MEEWRDIKGYEGLYQVSDMGNVRSVAHSTVYRDGRVGRYEGKMLVPDASGKTIKIFDSAAEAARQLGLSKGNISSCANGVRKTSGGYRWQFVQGVELCAS